MFHDFPEGAADVVPVMTGVVLAATDVVLATDVVVATDVMLALAVPESPSIGFSLEHPEVYATTKAAAMTETVSSRFICSAPV